jgi:hypothetical protein
MKHLHNSCLLLPVRHATQLGERSINMDCIVAYYMNKWNSPL